MTRILVAAVLTGILVKTGAATAISECNYSHIRSTTCLFPALAFATMLLTAVGFFIDVAVITVAPVALGLGRCFSIWNKDFLIELMKF